MHPAYASPPRRWLYALKPASWPKVLVPALVGQVLGFMCADAWSWGGAAVGLGFSLLALAYAVLLNDWCDIEVDALKRKLFPDAGMPKTIPDGVLPAESVLLAGVGAGVMAASIALAGELFLPGRPGLWLGACACLALLVVYSVPPVRVNDRGGGELIEALGVGALLPWWNAYAQSGDALSWWYALALPGLAMLALSSAIASGLSDEESDRRGGKTTLVTRRGNAAARAAVEYAALAGLTAWMLAARLSGGVFPPQAAFAALLAAIWPWRDLVRASPMAVTGAFAEQSRYKQALHRVVWWSALALAAALVLLRLTGAA